MTTKNEKNLDLHTTAVLEIGRIINSLAGEPDIVDVTPGKDVLGRWSQAKFKSIFTMIVATAAVIRECKNRTFVSALVSPDVAVALQSVSSNGDESDREFMIDMVEGQADEAVDAVVILNKFVTVYVDTFASESYSCVFATDNSDTSNDSILNEFPNLIMPTELLVVKTVYSGLNTYFGNVFPNIQA